MNDTSNSKTVSISNKATLIKMSERAKVLRQRKIDEAETDDEKQMIASLSVNYFLLCMHQAYSGHQVFKTFYGWMKNGFVVKKDEQAYRIWGTPKEIDKNNQSLESDIPSNNNYTYYPMCCLFHEGQVESIH